MSYGFAILIGLLLFNSILASARAALVGASRAKLRQMAERGSGGAARALRVAEDATLLIATVRLVQSASRFLAAGLLAVLLEPSLAAALASWTWLSGQGGPVALLLIMLLAALLVVTLGELMPEAWVMRAPEQWAVFLAPLVAVLEWGLSPLVRLMLFISARITRPIAGRQVPFVTEEEIKTMVDAGEEGGVLEEEEKEMIYSIFAIGDTLAREIMVPRIDMLALDVTTPLPEAVEAALSAGHSRIPVYQDNIDSIAGLLYAKDLLRAWRDGSQLAGLRSLLRPAYFVPETKKVDELLAELQAKRIHLAVVVDEYGGTAGIVTLEDIVEEIVGEIRDEYDVNEESLFERVSDTEYVFDARIDLDEVNELLQLDLPSGESDSLGGFIYSQLGHVPTPNEKVNGDQVEFEVLSVTGRRIRKVRALRHALDHSAETPPDTRRAGNGNGHTNGHAAPSGEPHDAD